MHSRGEEPSGGLIFSAAQAPRVTGWPSRVSVSFAAESLATNSWDTRRKRLVVASHGPKRRAATYCFRHPCGVADRKGERLKSTTWTQKAVGYQPDVRLGTDLLVLLLYPKGTGAKA